ncbi:unnamed protein product [Lymnaea stagnalis]|uniref:TERF1-interacting nuclear factor 2 N-terminal domain-containing protein n=1 Tax=Lymnaea stagnalis TaxID=6523 RepID=A0AAV2IDA4_LYMST
MGKSIYNYSHRPTELTKMHLFGEYLKLKQTILWLVVNNDIKENYGDALKVIDSLLEEASTLNCMEPYIRLALGLRMKDLVHSLTSDDFEAKLHSHFPNGTLPLQDEYLKTLFTEQELETFKDTTLETCNYFSCLFQNKMAVMELKSSYNSSLFGCGLTESLKNLVTLFFNTLEKNADSSRKKLDAQKTILPTESHQRDSLLNKQIAPIENVDIDQNKSSDYQSHRTSTVHSSCVMVYTDEETNNMCNFPKGLTVPSSQSMDEDTSQKQRINVPDLKIFLKQHDTRGCLVRLTQI